MQFRFTSFPSIATTPAILQRKGYLAERRVMLLSHRQHHYQYHHHDHINIVAVIQEQTVTAAPKTEIVRDSGRHQDHRVEYTYNNRPNAKAGPESNFIAIDQMLPPQCY